MSDEWAETDEWPLPRYTGSSKVAATFHPGDGLVWRDRGAIIAAQQTRIAQLEAQIARVEALVAPAVMVDRISGVQREFPSTFVKAAQIREALS